MAILAALLLVSCSSIPRASKDQLRHHPEVYTGRLENGLTYSLMNNPEPQKRLALRLVVSAGSALEDDDQQGLAHVVEHMAFNGTKSFRKQALVDFLEKMGVNFGAHLNAYTSFDETVYMLEVPTDSDNTNLVETAFQILSEWAGAVEFEAEEIDKERGVVIEEWRLRRGASQRLRDEQLPVLLKNSRYADRLPIGKKDILETFDHDRLRQYYKDWYRPNLMHVIAVGPMDKRQIESYIQKHFGQLKSNGRNPDHGIFDVPVIPGTLYSSATDP
jgi:zinc protease